MNVAMTGASSTGKTTLVEMVARDDSLSSYRCIINQARSTLVALGLSGMDDLSGEAFLALQLAIYIRKCSAEDEADSPYITDRSFVDLAAHWLEHPYTRNLPYTEEFLRKCRARSLVYNHHFFLPIGAIEFESDGMRATDDSWNAALDSRIQSLLGEWRLPYTTIEDVCLGARAEEVLSLIKRS